MIQLNSTRDLIEETHSVHLESIVLFGGIQYAYNYAADSPTQHQTETLAQQDTRGIDTTFNTYRSGFDYLPATMQEVSSIYDQLPKNINRKILSGGDATEASFKALSGKSPKVIHIATHGFFFPDVDQEEIDWTSVGSTFKYDDNPLFRSGLTFAGSNYAWKNGFNPHEEEDGILTAYEISQLDLSNTDLVVLSACETGLGDIQGSEGVFGLQRAFKMAGVEYLIMSLWQVPDKQTMMLMDRFYDKWIDGLPIRTAFREAQQELAQAYPAFYWAAFVMVGGGKETSEVKNSFWKNSYWFGIGFLLIVGLLLGMNIRVRE